MNEYQRANRARYEATGGRVGMIVNLSTGPFWSRGWRGCAGCGGDAKGHVTLTPFIHRANGVTHSGWRCNG